MTRNSNKKLKRADTLASGSPDLSTQTRLPERARAEKLAALTQKGNSNNIIHNANEKQTIH